MCKQYNLIMQSNQTRLKLRIKTIFNIANIQQVEKIKQVVKKASTIDDLVQNLIGFGLNPSDSKHKKFAEEAYNDYSKGMFGVGRVDNQLRTEAEDDPPYSDDSNNQDQQDQKWEQQLRELLKTEPKEKKFIPIPWKHELLNFKRKGVLNKAKGRASKRKRLQKKKEEKQRMREGRNSSKKAFSIQDYMSQVEHAINKKPIAIIHGANSQITTQLTIHLMQSQYGQIVCTQPSYNTAFTYANRISKQTNLSFGQEVACLSDSNNEITPRNRIVFATETVTKTILMNRMLEPRSVLIVDGAHRRTQSLDLIMAIIKQNLSSQQRQTPKIIITSNSEIQAKIISRYFKMPTQDIITIPTKHYPVLLNYNKKLEKNQQQNYLGRCAALILEIHNQRQQGNIVCFVPDEYDAKRIIVMIRNQPNTLNHRSTGLLVEKESFARSQRRARQPQAPKEIRQCLIATSIAEISITESPRYIIDCGFVIQSVEGSFSNENTLEAVWISKCQANERSNLAAPYGGECFRLYTYWAFSQMNELIIPELHRVHKSSLFLMMKEHEVKGLDFIGSPSSSVIQKALNQLSLIGPFHRESLDQLITDLSIDPKLALVMAYSVFFKCVDAMATICSMISVKDTIFDSSLLADKTVIASIKLFTRPKGDFLCLLAIYQDWSKNGYSSEWCKSKGIRINALLFAQEIKGKFIEILRKANMIEGVIKENIGEVSDIHIRKCLLHGFLENFAQLQKKESYRTKKRRRLFIHPCSTLTLSKTRPKCVIFEEIKDNTKMCLVSEIEPEWICDFEPSPEAYEY